MTILIINNYYKTENLSKVDQIVDALRTMEQRKHKIWSFSEINGKKIPDDVEAILLSGSAAHLQDRNHLSMYSAEIELVKQVELPVLGICFGHQLIGKAFGSQIHALPRFIKGFTGVKILVSDEIFGSWKKGKELILAQSHRDCLKSLPTGFFWLAESQSCKIEAMKHKKKPIYGIQAHIERASEENPHGWQILENFLSNVTAR